MGYAANCSSSRAGCSAGGLASATGRSAAIGDAIGAAGGAGGVALGRAGSALMARAGGREVEAGTESQANSCLSPHSFTGNTAVLLADGSTKAISQVRVGDQVSDAVPGVAAGGRHTVSRVIVTTTDRNFVDVTVKADRGSSRVGKAAKALVGAAAAAALVIGAAAPAAAAQAPAGSTVTTTDTHPFYDVTQSAFVPAGQLAVGDRVQTTDGATATITGLRDYHQSAVTYDLTIDGLHTYYVEAGATPLLVHNCGSSDAGASNRLTDSVPVLRYPGKSLPQTAQNMQRYMLDHGLDETSTFTKVDPKVAAANLAANRTIYGGGPSMEEFPFASTTEGGPGAYLTQVDPAEQSAQGNLLRNFYRTNGVRPGDPFGIFIDWGH